MEKPHIVQVISRWAKPSKTGDRGLVQAIVVVDGKKVTRHIKG